MSTMTLEQYLYGDNGWDVEPDWVSGRIEDRDVGQKEHSKWQRAITRFFDRHRDEWGLDAFPELRTRPTEASYRTPDVLVLAADAPDEQIITHPPLAVFEILSPDDRVYRTQERLAEYEAMGVPAIYLIHPETGRFQRWQAGGLLLVTECTVGGHTFATHEISALVN